MVFVFRPSWVPRANAPRRDAVTSPADSVVCSSMAGSDGAGTTEMGP